MKLGLLAGIACLVMLIGGLAPTVPGSGGIDSVSATENNAIIIKATDNPMNAFGGLAVNGTSAHIIVTNIPITVVGPLRLHHPLGDLVVSKPIPTDRVVAYLDIALAPGWWDIVDAATVNLVTTFEADEWDGLSTPSNQSSLVTYFPDSANFTSDLLDLYSTGTNVVVGPQEARVDTWLDFGYNSACVKTPSTMNIGLPIDVANVEVGGNRAWEILPGADIRFALAGSSVLYPGGATARPYPLNPVFRVNFVAVEYSTAYMVFGTTMNYDDCIDSVTWHLT